MAVQVLREKLAAKAAPEVADTSRVMTLVEEGIVMARELARGLAPVELEAEGLMAALQELAASISKWSKVSCVFECESPVLVHDANTAMQLYRIAQESVSNAIRHGRAGHIVINLEKYGAGLALSVEDDGVGLPKLESAAGPRHTDHVPPGRDHWRDVFPGTQSDGRHARSLPGGNAACIMNERLGLGFGHQPNRRGIWHEHEDHPIAPRPHQGKTQRRRRHYAAVPHPRQPVARPKERMKPHRCIRSFDA